MGGVFQFGRRHTAPREPTAVFEVLVYPTTKGGGGQGVNPGALPHERPKKSEWYRLTV